MTFTCAEAERIVKNSFRVCRKGRHPHVWNKATRALALFDPPRASQLLRTETCEAHGGARWNHDCDVTNYIETTKMTMMREEPKMEETMNNRERVLQFFEQRNNKPATLYQINEHVRLVRGSRKQLNVLREVLQAMKTSGHLAWTRSGPGKLSTYSIRPAAAPSAGPSAEAITAATASPAIGVSYIVANKSKGTELTDAREQSTLDGALADWTARRTAGGAPRLFKVVELHPTLTAKL